MVRRQVQITVERPRERIVLVRAHGVLDRDAAAGCCAWSTRRPSSCGTAAGSSTPS